MRLHIIVPSHVTAEDLETAARALGVRLIAQANGSVIGLPITSEHNRQGNQGWHKIRRHNRQIIGHSEGPKTA